jgi:hypothetical protein
MAKTKISEFDATASGNTDIDGINIAEGMSPGLVNNAFRELMAQLKDFQTGVAGDSLTVGGNLAVTGTATVNSNLVDAFPANTVLLFNQTTAPTGWTKLTTHNNKALRVVSGVVGTGGSIDFTTAFGSQNVDNTTLTTDQIPAHTHSFSATTGSNSVGHAHGFTATTSGIGDHAHGIAYQGNLLYSGGGGNPNTFFGGGVNQSTAGAGAHSHTVSGTTGDVNANHTHTLSGTTGSLGGGNAHTHSLNLAVSYVDVIMASKN